MQPAKSFRSSIETIQRRITVTIFYETGIKMERVQSVCLTVRQIVNDPWCVKNENIRENLKIAGVRYEIIRFTEKHKG